MVFLDVINIINVFYTILASFWLLTHVFTIGICCGTAPSVAEGSCSDVKGPRGDDETVRDDPATHRGAIGGDPPR